MIVDKTHLIDISRGKRNMFEYEISFLILDFNKPEETKKCLASIKHFVKFNNYQIVLFSNGGSQDYVIDLYKDKQIDKLILSQKNYGCGAGTHFVFNNADAEVSMYVQNDQYMCRDFYIEELNEMKKTLETNIKCIDLSGGAGHSDKFSERAHIINTDLFNKNPEKGYGGPGPFEKVCWSEEMTRIYLDENDYKVHHNWRMLFANNGRYSVREDKEGKVIRKDLYTGETIESYRV